MHSNGKTLLLYNANTTTDTLCWSLCLREQCSAMTYFPWCCQWQWFSISTAVVQESTDLSAVRHLAQMYVLRSCKKLSVTSPRIWARPQVAPVASPMADKTPVMLRSQLTQIPTTSHILSSFLIITNPGSFSNDFPKIKMCQEQPTVRTTRCKASSCSFCSRCYL